MQTIESPDPVSNPPSSVAPSRSPRSAGRPSRKAWIYGLLCVCLLMGGGLWIRSQGPRSSGQARQLTAPVDRTTLAVTVAANGKVEAKQLVNISPKISGILQEMVVAEGDWVEQGQILARMDDQELQAQVKQAQGQLLMVQAELERLTTGYRPQEIAQAAAQLRQTEAQLAQLQEGSRPEEIAQAQARLQQSQSTLDLTTEDLERTRALSQEGAISQQTLDQAESAYAGALAQVQEAQQALNLLQTGSRLEEIMAAQAQREEAQQALDLLESGSRAEEIAAAQAQVISADGSLQEAQARLASATLRAPFAGVVLRKYADPGAFVTPTTSGSSESSATSTSILALASQVQIVANISESEIAQIQIGQPVTIEAEAYPDQTFTGQVTQISPQAIEEQNVTSFEVKVDLVPEPSPERSMASVTSPAITSTSTSGGESQPLRIGMNVTLDFQVGQRQDTLAIPTVAIVRQDSGTGVYVVDPDQNPQFVPITVGVTVDRQTEVLSGLSGSEQILLSVSQQDTDRSGPQRGRGLFPRFSERRSRGLGGL